MNLIGSQAKKTSTPAKSKVRVSRSAESKTGSSVIRTKPVVEKPAERKEEQVQKMPAPAAKSPMVAKGGGSAMASNSATSSVNPVVDGKINSTLGSGKHLDGGTQAFMGSRMGQDFDHVKIHNDENSHELSNSLGAKAFTVGSDIYFNKGEYNPQSLEGKHLLAHELTHVVQQSDEIQRNPMDGRPSRDWNIPIMAEDISNESDREEFLAQLRAEKARKDWQNAMDRLSKGELDDNDLPNSRLKNKLTGYKTSEISDLITKIKAFQVQRDKDIADPSVKDSNKKVAITTDKIVEWLEVRKVISTPMPDGAKVDSALPGMIDSYSVTYNGVLIKVMPDTSSTKGNSTESDTNFKGRFAWSTGRDGIIKTLTQNGSPSNPTQLELTITTAYNDSADGPSGYGKGTTDQDKADGTTTLRAHEGKHGTDYINYVKDNPMPASLSGGVVGILTGKQFQAILNYVKEISVGSCMLTDQVGFTQNQFLKTPEGKASGIVSCKP